MILRYPPIQQQTNSSSCSLFPTQFDSPFPVMNNNTSNNFRLSFIHHSTEIENENNSSLMNDEPPCTPCSTWLSLTSLHQLSFNSNNNLNPNCNTSDMTSLSSSTTSTTTSCTISSNSNNNVESQLMPPPSFQFPTSIPSNNSAKDLFEEEFRLKCSKYRKVNEASRSVSSLTPCSASSAKSLETSNEQSSQDLEKSTCNNSPTTTDNINLATASIVSKVLSNVLSKSSELKQKKIQKRSGFKRQDIPRLVIPSDQSSAIFVKNCSLQNGRNNK